MAFEPFDRVAEGVYVRPDCRAWLEQDLLSDFADVGPVVELRGRSPHFIYLPKGAPRRIIVRRPVRGGLISFLGRNYLGTRRIEIEISALHAAQTLGIRVPELVGYRIDPGFLFYKKFTLVYYEIEEARSLDTVRPLPVREVARAVRALHDARILHRDLNLKNILVTKDGIAFVDLGQAKLGVESCIPDIVRLNRSAEKFKVGLLDRIRFLRAYEPDRGRRRQIARACARNLALHRIWWAIAGRCVMI